MIGVDRITLSISSIGPAASFFLSLGRVVVWRAQRLPVRPIIKKIVIAFVWRHVVHDGGRCRPALILTIATQRMIFEVGGAALTPLLCGVEAAPFLGF